MRKLIPIFALCGACAMMGKNEPKSDAVATQDHAANQFQAAADAQKRASEEQKKADEADRKVEEAQKALAEARAQARGQHSKATQAQDEARQLAQQSSQQGMQAQDRASKLQTSGIKQNEQKVQQNQSWMQEQKLNGQVLTADGSMLKVRTADKKDISLNLSDSTNVKIDGQQAKASQIKPGDDVRASYQMVDGQAKALDIDVQSNTDSSTSSRK